jgi:hypothetical protein
MLAFMKITVVRDAAQGKTFAKLNRLCVENNTSITQWSVLKNIRKGNTFMASAGVRACAGVWDFVPPPSAVQGDPLVRKLKLFGEFST